MSELAHINSAFDDDLAAINDDVVRLGALAQAQLAASLDSLTHRALDVIEEIILRDRELDQLDHNVGERAIQLIALRHPMAEDLRRVMVAIKVANALERIGDFAKGIARRNRILIQAGVRDMPLDEVQKMGLLVQQMLHSVLDAYAEHDSATARILRNRDVAVDRLDASVFDALVAEMTRTPASALMGAHLLFIAKSIERVGDYATGIAEQICFLVDGFVPSDERPKICQTEPDTH